MIPARCHDLRISWDDYRISNMADEQSEAVEQHLEVCPHCREFVDVLGDVGKRVEDARMDPLTRRRLAVAASGNKKNTRVSGSFARPIVFVPAALIAAASIAMIFIFFPDPKAPVKRTALYHQPTPIAHDVTKSPTEPIPEVQSSPDGRRFIEVFEGTALVLDENAKAHADRADDSIAHFLLESGRVVAVVGPHPPGFRFVVVTPEGNQVESKGTVFSVEAMPGEQEKTRVLKGTVEVRGSGSPITRTLCAGREMLLNGLLESDASAENLERDRTLAFSVVPETNNDRDPVADRSITAGYSSPPDSALDKKKESRSDLAVQAITENRFSDAEVLIGQVVNENPRSKETRTLLARLARAYRRARLFQPAADTYRRLIAQFPGNDSAVNGTVALAQIELDALGETENALGHFNQYLAEAPEGVLAQAARAGKVRALQRMGQFTTAIEAIDDFMKKHATDGNGAEMLRRRGDSLAKLGRCEQALEEYNKVIAQWPGSPESRKASSGISACGEKN